MAEFMEVMKQKQRMHEYILGHEQLCSKCPISESNNRHNMGCDSFIAKHPQEAEKLIMDWAEEHPIISNKDKFKEVFGFETTCELTGCYLIKCPSGGCNECKYRVFWEQEYKEPDKE